MVGSITLIITSTTDTDHQQLAFRDRDHMALQLQGSVIANSNCLINVTVVQQHMMWNIGGANSYFPIKRFIRLPTKL